MFLNHCKMFFCSYTRPLSPQAFYGFKKTWENDCIVGKLCQIVFKTCVENYSNIDEPKWPHKSVNWGLYYGYELLATCVRFL